MEKEEKLYSIQLDKRHGFLLLTILLAIFVVYKTWPITIEPNVHVVVTKNTQDLSKLQAKRKVDFKNEYFVDVLYFKEAEELIHYRLGPLAFVQDFFIDAKANFFVETAGKYTFEVYSDDGFQLLVDKMPVCEWLEDRSYDKDSGEIFLSKGIHGLELKYFQGKGPMGLKVSYCLTKEKKFYLVGKNSPHIVFVKFDKKKK